MLVVLVGLGCLLVGVWIGSKATIVLRRQVDERVEDLIRLIETVQDLTPDHRINPIIPLNHLHLLRKELL